jgi:hypothetical protein
VPIQSLLKPAAVSQSDFFEWNPALNTTTTVIPAGYRIKIPPEKAGRFAIFQRRTLDSLATKKSGVITTRNHAGSANGKIAAKNKKARGTSVGAARSAGRLSTSKAMTATQRLKIASR